MYIPVKAGDNVKMMQLLSLGYSPNARFASECENGTPLHVAASEGHVLTTHILVQAGAELDTLDDEQNTALMLACIKGRSEVVRYLLQAGADLTLRGDDGMTCLHLATQNGFLECAHVILNQRYLEGSVAVHLLMVQSPSFFPQQLAKELPQHARRGRMDSAGLGMREQARGRHQVRRASR